MSDLSFESLFGDASLEIDCPECGALVPFNFNDVGGIIKCPNCSTEIQLDKADNFDESVESVNNSLEDFEKTLKNFGK